MVRVVSSLQSNARTGAGDLFAAGVIGELLQSQTAWENGCRRGMLLASDKIGIPGPLSEERVKQLFAQEL